MIIFIGISIILIGIILIILLNRIDSLEKKIEQFNTNIIKELSPTGSFRQEDNILSAQIQDLSNRICDLTDLKELVEKNMKKGKGGNRQPRDAAYRKKIGEGVRRAKDSKKQLEELIAQSQPTALYYPSQADLRGAEIIQ